MTKDEIKTRIKYNDLKMDKIRNHRQSTIAQRDLGYFDGMNTILKELLNEIDNIEILGI